MQKFYNQFILFIFQPITDFDYQMDAKNSFSNQVSATNPAQNTQSSIPNIILTGMNIATLFHSGVY